MTSLAVFLVGLLMWATESLRPAQSLPRVRTWWTRTVLLNALQVAVVLAAGHLLDPVLVRWSLGAWREHHTVLGGIGGYLVLTLVYYWWHRARHSWPALWRHVHQMHHSPVRLEVWTSFYKHPTELLANAILSSATMFLLLGLSPAQAAVATLLSGLAELFYHWNVRTPRWLGWFVQRPEMHRVHHQRGAHRHNYGDLPLWDILFGTFHNPKTGPEHCGFAEDRENRFGELLLGVDVHQVAPGGAAIPSRLRAALVFVVGALGVAAHLSGSSTFVGLATAMQLSPAPKVFTTHHGVETFSGTFVIEGDDDSGPVAVVLDRHNMATLRGPYNRRNVYGAVFAYLPALFRSGAFMNMARPVAQTALCGAAPLLGELDPPRSLVPGRPRRIVVRPDDSSQPIFSWEVPCPPS